MSSDESMSKEETKLLAEAIVTTASEISKTIDTDIVNGFIRGDNATIIAASIASMNNIAAAERMNTSDTASVEEMLAEIAELDPVKLNEDFEKENPDKIKDVTVSASYPADSDDVSKTPAPSAVNAQIEVRIWTKRLRRYGKGISIVCSMLDRQSTQYRHWAIEYRGVFLDLHKDPRDGSVSLRVVDDDMKKEFDKAKTIARSEKDTVALRKAG
jgi:hypothetical protein